VANPEPKASKVTSVCPIDFNAAATSAAVLPEANSSATKPDKSAWPVAETVIPLDSI
jgi:hypothetical protein